jgi:leucyl aminopeptidase
VWPLPLYDEYGDDMKSEVADIKNSGGRWGGASTAAAFLKFFVKKGVAWAHLDIAGTAWKSGAAKGATGRPVPLLTTFLLNRV